MSERFYLNWPLMPGPVTLEGAEARHLATVCRLRPGDAICLFNGDGHEYPARIVETDRRRVTVEIDRVEAPQRELPFALELAAPVPKGDRAQFLVEKLTELGVTSFVPLACARSVVHPGEAKLEKLGRYVIEASKQCGRNVLMRIEPVTAWTAYCASKEVVQMAWMAHPQLNSVGSNVTGAGRPSKIAVGPEGGFTEPEVAAGREHGWDLIDLGPRILRIETAAILLACRAMS